MPYLANISLLLYDLKKINITRFEFLLELSTIKLKNPSEASGRNICLWNLSKIYTPIKENYVPEKVEFVRVQSQKTSVKLCPR